MSREVVVPPLVELLDDDELLEGVDPCGPEEPPQALVAKTAAPTAIRRIDLKLIASTVARLLAVRAAAVGGYLALP